MGRSKITRDTKLPVKSPLCFGYLTQNRIFAAVLKGFDVFLKLLPKQLPAASNPKRILVSNWGQLGDVYYASALVPLIQRFFPDAEIGFLVSTAGAPAIKAVGGVTHVHIVDHWFQSRLQVSRMDKIRAYLRSRRIALSELRQVGYDVAIETFSHPPNSGSLMWQAGIPRRIGYPIGSGRRFFTDLVPWSHDPKRHVLLDHIHLFNVLLGRDSGATPDHRLLPCGPESSAPQLLRSVLQEPYVLLHVGTGGPLKEWPTSHWQELAERLDGHGIRLVFTGRGPRESDVITAITAGLPKSINLCDKLTYAEFVGVLRHASLMVGVDSVAAHLSGGANIPGVFIYHGMADILRWSPVSDHRVVLSTPLPCSPCQSGRGCETMGCVRQVTAEEVGDECLNLLSQHISMRLRNVPARSFS